MQMWEDAYRRWLRMDAYAMERSKELGNAEATSLAERSKALGARLDEAAAFIQPEIRKLGRAKVQKLIALDKGLAKYRAPVDAILHAKPNAPIDPRTFWNNQ